MTDSSREEDFFLLYFQENICCGYSLEWVCLMSTNNIYFRTELWKILILFRSVGDAILMRTKIICFFGKIRKLSIFWLQKKSKKKKKTEKYDDSFYAELDHVPFQRAKSNVYEITSEILNTPYFLFFLFFFFSHSRIMAWFSILFVYALCSSCGSFSVSLFWPIRLTNQCKS